MSKATFSQRFSLATFDFYFYKENVLPSTQKC